MPMWQAVEYVAETIGDTDFQGCYPEARRQVRQAGLDARLEIWGKKAIPPSHLSAPLECSEVWSPIDPDYWQDFRLNSMAIGSTWDAHPHTEAEPHVSQGIISGQYWALRVHKPKIEIIWPRPAPPRTRRRPNLGPNGWMAS